MTIKAWEYKALLIDLTEKMREADDAGIKYTWNDRGKIRLSHYAVEDLEAIVSEVCEKNFTSIEKYKCVRDLQEDTLFVKVEFIVSL